ncbi:MAG: RNA-splicing ligase RtcB, partial [Planctomycetes bacterium GWC2_49_10]
LAGGAVWAVEKGWGTKQDLSRVEENGAMRGAEPKFVSEEAKRRQLDEVGTLGSGNHYLELQRVDHIYDTKTALAFGLKENDIVISIHCGSRGLGHQIGTDYLKKMVTAAPGFGINLPERELACAPIKSPLGQSYIGAMRAGINCALANRQVLTHLVREAFAAILPKAHIKLLYDVSHNTCKEESHKVNGKTKRLFVHRKGATRSFGPGDVTLPPELKDIGQPVIIGGTMGTSSFVLVGTSASLSLALGSSCHGAGRQMSRNKATEQFQGRAVVKQLAQRGIIIRSPSLRGVAEEAPEAYKDVEAVVGVANNAGLSRTVAKVVPLVCVKG